MNILFLCVGNSCRSIIAEALLNSMKINGVTAQSAGSNPTFKVNPKALKALQKQNIPINNLSSKSWDNLPIKPSLVISLCHEAENEACPVYLGNVLRSHWPVEDPSHVIGDDMSIEKAFDFTVEILQNRLKALEKLLDEKQNLSQENFQEKLDQIGKI